MKKQITILVTVICCWLCASSALLANNIVINSTGLTGQDDVADFTHFRFNLSWENSWRVAAAPSNWDAAWVFVKYKVTGGPCTTTEWKHATLSTTSTDHTYNVVGSNITPTFVTVPNGEGVLIHRTLDGSGTAILNEVELRWNYGLNGIGDLCKVTFKVMAVEMVYVPGGGGPFSVGDGATGQAQFEADTSGSPLLITSELALTLGGGGAGSLGNNNKTNQNTLTYDDDFDDGNSVTLPAAFPKGYNSFYCMKYEVSQEQYKEFLNTLTASQQVRRAGGTFFSTSKRNGIKIEIPSVGGNPALYANDLDNDGNFNEPNDGQFIACNHLDQNDALAYLDWAGLRPMTELEYEKSCRGAGITPFANEYAWGGTAIVTNTGTILNSGAENELPSNPSIATSGNARYQTNLGPLRCGIFAIATSTRTTAGATFYGIMEMSGNVSECCVSVGSVAGRSYTGVHGDGELTDFFGAANVDFWPGVRGTTNNGSLTLANSAYIAGGFGAVTHTAGLGQRGGGTKDAASRLEISARFFINTLAPSFREGLGCRGVRTAP